MTSRPESDIERLTSLIEVKLSDLETRTNAGEIPSTSELNAIRRLVLWVEGERELARVRELTTSSRGPKRP